MSLSEHFKLDPNSPSYVAWARDSKSNRGKFRAGDPVVGESAGYYAAGAGGRYHMMHRVVYELTHGHCPAVIDHIDGNRKNNHPDNLRAADTASNGWNATLRANNTSGIKGLSKHGQCEGWCGHVRKNGKRYSKYSKDKDEVIAWLIATRAELHQEYANNG